MNAQTKIGKPGSSQGQRYNRFIKDLRQQMANRDALLTDNLAVVDALRNWVFRNTPRASGEAGTLCIVEPFPHSAAAVLQIMREQGSGYWCAGHAALLVCAYRDLGLRSAVMAFGLADGFTHAVTMVEIGQDWFLQDPYSNLRIATDCDKEASFAEVWRRLSDGGAVGVLASQNRLQPFIFCDREKVAWNVTFPFGVHRWHDACSIGLFHVSEGQFYQHPQWPPTEAALTRNSSLDSLSSLFFNPLWLSDPINGYHEIAIEHPLWSEIVDMDASDPDLGQ